MSTYCDKVLAVSLMLSLLLPKCNLFWSMIIHWPPSFLMATSKDNLVLVDGFSNIEAKILPFAKLKSPLLFEFFVSTALLMKD